MVSLAKKTIWHRIFGSEECIKKFPLFNRIVLGYIGVCVVIYTLFMIAPFVTWISGTPLYHVQSALGILGALLVCVDLLTTKALWRGNYSWLLYVLSALAVLASLRTISYGSSDNLFILCWTVVQFALFYSCAWRMEYEILQRWAKQLFLVVLAIWFAACCVSLYQFFAQIGYMYIIDPKADDLSAARQGFYDNRLFGVFNPLNHAVYISLSLLAISLYYMTKARSKAEWLSFCVVCFVLFSHLVLSGSRSAELSAIACSLFAAFCLLRRRFAVKSSGKRTLLSLGGALLAACVVFGCFAGMKAVYSHVPEWMGISPVEDDNILEREGLEDDASNSRFDIWKDYISLYDEVGAIGLSPGNYMSYIRENHPELFIVNYMLKEYPDKAASGIIYHVHNGYLMTYVSGGILGLAALLAFLVLNAIEVVKRMLRTPLLSNGFILLCALIGMECIAAVFDKAVFFMDNPTAFLFWLALGLLMRDAAEQKES